MPTLKRLLSVLLCCLLLAAAVVLPANAAPAEIRAVWISYFELTAPKGGWNQESFTKKFDSMFQRLQRFGIQVVFVHVRPFSDALYPTKKAPWSEILTGKQGKNPGYDPLKILCELSQTYGLQLHAWLNPFRITRDSDLQKLAKNHPARAHITANDHWVGKAGGQYYWNPAQVETHSLVYAAVRELLQNYPLAGIHIDDYFYPTTASAFDQAQYTEYKEQGGTLGRGAWRRELVSQFVSGLYRTAKKAKPSAVVSVSPTANIEKDRDTLYADVLRWMREPGFADWILPQIYFGFQNESMPFKATAKRWAQEKRHKNLKLLFGLAAYKTGQADDMAGEKGRLEWKKHSDVLARQLKYARKLSGYTGFALYSYRGLFADNITKVARQERENLQKLLI